MSELKSQTPAIAPTDKAPVHGVDVSPESVSPPPSETPPQVPKHHSGHRFNRWVKVLAAVIVLVGVGIYLIPAIRTALNTVSTDDAYVNGHVTFVAPRVSGQVVKVFVDNNNRVKKGDVLVVLDKEPYQIQVNLSRAAVDLAKADVASAYDQARAAVAKLRSLRFQLENAIEKVNNQVATLKAKAAALTTSQARLARARADLDRSEGLAKSEATTQQDLDLKREAFRVADAQVLQSLEEIHEVRASLGLPVEPADGKPLTDVPEDLDQNFSEVRRALADLMQGAATLGYFPGSYQATPKEVIAEFYKQDPAGNLDKIFEKLIAQVPELLQAKANLTNAENQLAQAELNLSWCDVRAEIDGQVTNRNVNPGNNVQVGQSLMTVRSLTEIWIDANFKETQLRNLRIGQRVDMKVDMYGSSVRFPGRITGFSMGTGSTLAILPPENATGNFIKVVQRLPVRIEPIDYDATTHPLFIGLSVVPYVYVKEPPISQDAGAFLQTPIIDLTPAKAESTEQPTP